MSKLIKKAIIFVVAFILIAVLWSVFSGKKKDSASLTVTGGQGTAVPLSSDGDIVEDTFLNTLLNISAISLNDSVFDDPRFMSLQDFTVTLIPQAVGRTNPFLQTGSTVPLTTTTTTTAPPLTTGTPTQ